MHSICNTVASAAIVNGGLSASAVVLLLAAECRAGEAVNTPFQQVPLVSKEMRDALTGRPDCSGEDPATACEPLSAGFCGGRASFYFRTPGVTVAADKVPPRQPSKQADAAAPQYFLLEIGNAGSSGNLFDLEDPKKADSIDLFFNCSYGDMKGCPTGRFHAGQIRSVEVMRLEGDGRRATGGTPS